MAAAGSWEEPVTGEVEEASVRPVARGDEQDQQQEGAVDAWPVEEIGADEEQEYEGWGGVCRDKEQREPTASSLSV